MERRLADLEDDFDSARRAAEKAEEKATQEERSRKLAEERLEEERRGWVQREHTVREEAGKAVLSDLAAVFARAALAPSSVWGGIGPHGDVNNALFGSHT